MASHNPIPPLYPCSLDILLHPKFDQCEASTGVWWYHHGPNPRGCYCIIRLWPISSMCNHWKAIAGLSLPSTPTIPMLTSHASTSKFWPIWGGYRCVVASPSSKHEVMVLYHPYETYIKYLQPQESNCWPHITLNPTIPMITSHSATSEFWPIWCDYRCVVVSPWPKPQVMVLHHPSRTYIKYDHPLESNYWPHITLNSHYSHAH